MTKEELIKELQDSKEIEIDAMTLVSIKRPELSSYQYNGIRYFRDKIFVEVAIYEEVELDPDELLEYVNG